MKAIVTVPNELRPVLEAWQDGEAYQLDVVQDGPFEFTLIDARPLVEAQAGGGAVEAEPNAAPADQATTAPESEPETVGAAGSAPVRERDQRRGAALAILFRAARG